MSKVLACKTNTNERNIRWKDFLVELRLTIIRRRKTAANLIYRFFLSLFACCMRCHRTISFEQFWSTLSQLLLRCLLFISSLHLSSFFVAAISAQQKICRQPPLIVHLEFMNALKQSHSDCIIINYFTLPPGGFAHTAILQSPVENTITISRIDLL